MRAENTRIVSEKHALQTVSTNRICLFAFDNKRHILNKGIKTLPFGHYKIDHCRVKDFYCNSDEVEWDYENVENFDHLLLDWSPNWDHNNRFVVPDTTISESPEEWETPDPGLALTIIINEDEIDSDDIVDFDATTSSSSSSPNPLINYEANECSESSSDYEEESAFRVARRQNTCSQPPKLRFLNSFPFKFCVYEC